MLMGYILTCSISTVYSYFKFKSLNFHPRDFPFYLQFAAKLGDRNLSDQYSLNPDGHNFIGFYGTEGEDNFHRTLHFEPVKYTYSLVYLLFKTPVALFLFGALIFFSPVVYFAFIHYKRQESSHAIVWFFAILYIFTTLTLETVSFDLRPFIFLGPVFAVLIFSIHFDRPHWEKILLFNCLFLIREEAMLFAGAALIYTAALEYTRSKKIFLAKVFTLNWLVWVGILFLYYGWTGFAFTNYLKVFQHVPSGKFILVGIGLIFLLGLSGPGFFIIKKRNQQVSFSLLILFSYSLIFFPVLMGFLPYFARVNLKFCLLLVYRGARYYFLYITVIVFLVLVWDLFLKNREKRILNYIIFIILGCLMVFTGRAAYDQLNRYIKQEKPAAVVFSVRENTDKYKTGILCDYSTYQAFYDYENVFCYSRLPSYMISGPNRYYPENVEHLKQLIKEKLDYVVLEVKNKENRQVIKQLNLDRFPIHAQNGKYVIYKVITARKGS